MSSYFMRGYTKSQRLNFPMATLEEVMVWRLTTHQLDLQIQIRTTVISGENETQILCE